MLGFYLWVGDGDVEELVDRLLSLLDGEIVLVGIACQFIHTNIKSLGDVLFLWEHIGCWSGDADKLAAVGVGRQGPVAIGIGLDESDAVVYHYVSHAIALGILHSSRENEGGRNLCQGIDTHRSHEGERHQTFHLFHIA